MAKKDLIIGAFTNYNYNQIKPWVESIDDSGFKGVKAMVVGQASEDTIGELIKRDFIIIKMHEINAPIHVARFFSIYDFLKTVWQDYRYIVTTDVKDVIFQYDPMTWLEKNLGEKKLVAGSESIRYKDEPWGNENLMQAYGMYVHEHFKENEIYNVGTIGGVSEYVKDMMFNILFNAINRPIPICDQAVYNVLIQTQPFKNIIYFAKQSDGWACQAGTTVDPTKIESFRPHLLEEEPWFDNGYVWTHNREMFSIVHQYDRVPEWKEFVRKKYGQEDETQYFKYKV